MANGTARVLIAGLFAGCMVAILSVTFAALIFSGPLASHLSAGIVMMLLAGLVAGTGIALFSHVSPILAMADEDTTPVLALMLSLVIAAMPAAASDQAGFSTAVATIVITTVLTGAGLSALGLAGFGRFIQFLPHSVMGGYFSAVGWLLVLGGLQLTLAGASSTAGQSGWADQAALWTHWVPALAMALFLSAMQGRVSKPLLLPATVAIAIPAWFGLAWMTGLDLTGLAGQGYFLGPFAADTTGLAHPFQAIDPALVEWRAILENATGITTILLIAALSLMLSISGLGLAYRQDPEMNHELKVAGLSNLASGLAGGMVGIPSYSLSTLSSDMGSRDSRWPPLVGLLSSAVIVIAGLDFIGFVPRFVLGGILGWMGLSLLREWVVDGRHKFSPLEYLVIPIILVISILAGFLEGVMVGLVAAIILFVVKYSRTRVVRFTADGAQIMSNVDRAADDEAYLREHGQALFVVGLQGYLFFGTSHQVYEAFQRRLDREGSTSPDLLVLDFSQVTGLDASAALYFQQMARLRAAAGTSFVLSGLGDELRDRLETGGLTGTDSVNLVYMQDLDSALEWAENQILSGTLAAALDLGCFEQMSGFLDATQIQVLKGFLESRQVEAGEVLARQGEESQAMFFMETCAGSAWISTAQGDSHRVRQSMRGTVFGELGFYLGVQRTATVIADGAGLVYVLDLGSLERLQREQPEVAAGFHRYMANLLSERLMFTTKTLRALLM
jgi:SulP family sulfate permease